VHRKREEVNGVNPDAEANTLSTFEGIEGAILVCSDPGDTRSGIILFNYHGPIEKALHSIRAPN